MTDNQEEPDFTPTSLQVERRGDVGVIHVVGELDLRTASGLEEEAALLVAEGAWHCVIDLNPTSSIDSIGVAALIRAHRSCTGQGGAVFLAGAHGMVAEIIKITQLHRVVKVLPTFEEAVAVAADEARTARTVGSLEP